MCRPLPQGTCVACSDVLEFGGGTASPTSSPTSSPFRFGGFFDYGDTPAPVGLFPNTLSPNAFEGGRGGEEGEFEEVGTLNPVDISEGEGVGAGQEGEVGAELTACGCLENLSETEAEVLAVRGKALVCDPTCLDGSDLIWGES